MKQNFPYKVTINGTNARGQTVTVAIQAPDGRIDFSESLEVGSAPTEILVEACLQKAYGRYEARLEAQQSAGTK